MTASMFPREDAPRDPHEPGKPRREAPSFADISGEFPDPVLLERQRRLRRVVWGVMVGAIGLLLIAGICGSVRRSSAEAESVRVAPAAPVIAAAEVPPSDPAPASPPPNVETVAPAQPAALAPPAPPLAPLSKARRAKPTQKSGSAAALVRPH